MERFRREARAAARLHHTNIVPVFEVGQDGDVRFYAMQLIQGLGLDEVIIELRRLRDRAGSQVKREGLSETALAAGPASTAAMASRPQHSAKRSRSARSAVYSERSVRPLRPCRGAAGSSTHRHWPGPWPEAWRQRAGTAADRSRTSAEPRLARTKRARHSRQHWPQNRTASA